MESKTDNGSSVTGVSNPKSLDEISLETFHKLIPAVVLISILMLLGIFGNTFAFCYYGFRVKKMPTEIFIFSLTIFDLLLCFISMPMEIIDIRYYHSFPSKDVCKSLRFVNYFASIASGFTLIAIAVERYRKICKPFNKQITIKQAKICICAVVFLSVLLSWPSCVIYTVTDKNMASTPSTHASDCTTNNDPEMVIYILVYTIIHFLIFVSAMFILIVLYILVGRTLRQHQNFRAAYLTPTNHSKVSPTKQTSFMNSNDNMNSREIQKNEQPTNTITNSAHQTTNNNAGLSSSSKTEDKTLRMTHRNSEIIQTKNGKYRNQTISSVRYTCITLSITVAFVVSYLPYLCITVWRSLKQTNERNILTEAEFLTVEIFLRSFIINSAVNPLIYGFFNTDFRKFMINTFQLCFCCRRCDKTAPMNSKSNVSCYHFDEGPTIKS